MPAYPLEAVATLRAEEQSARERALAQAIARAEQAAAERDRALAACRAHAESTERTLEQERARGASGHTVSDAQRLADWRRGRAVELAALSETARARKADADARADEVVLAREALATARAEVEALAKHRARWEAEERARLERRAEAELDDRTSHAASARGRAP